MVPMVSLFVNDSIFHTKCFKPLEMGQDFSTFACDINCSRIGSIPLFECLPHHVAYCAKGLFQRILNGFPYILTGFLLCKYDHKANNVIFVLSLLALSLTAFYFHVEIFPLLGGVALFLISYKIELSDNVVYGTVHAMPGWSS